MTYFALVLWTMHRMHLTHPPRHRHEHGDYERGDCAICDAYFEDFDARMDRLRERLARHEREAFKPR